MLQEWDKKPSPLKLKKIPIQNSILELENVPLPFSKEIW